MDAAVAGQATTPAGPPSTAATLAAANAAIAAEVKAGRLPPEAAPAAAETPEQWQPGQDEPETKASGDAPAKAPPETPAAPEPPKVTPDERAGFRAEKRKWREKIDSERRAFDAEIAAARAETASLIKARDAIAAGDYETAMQAAFGLGVSELNKKLVEKHSGKDPRFERLEREAAELRSKVEAREKADAEARAEAERVAAEREWTSQVSTDLAAVPGLAGFAKNEHFLRQIVQVQRRHWDGEETLSASEAAAEVLAELDTPASRGIYELLRHVFGDRDARNPEARSNAGATRSGADSAKRAPKSVSHTRAGEVAPAEPGEFSHDRWKARWSKRIEGSTE